MALDKHYSNLVGLDTRSNKIAENPKSVRRGSKNFRYNFQDEIVKANGFQHKTATLSSPTVGDIEYKYTDPNTGAAKSTYLVVCQNGRMYKKVAHYIKFSNLNGAQEFSFYYDEVASKFYLTIDALTPIEVSQSMTMNQLKTAINALGLTCTVVDDDDTAVASSTKLAYLVDTIIDSPLAVETNTYLSSWFWEEVDFPSKDTSSEVVPFITTSEFYSNADYEGISYINLNNVVYITDGGFPMKYDGKSVYRAGIPKMLKPLSNVYNFSGCGLDELGVELIKLPGGGLIPTYKYKYIFQMGFVDYQGSTIMGDYEVGTSPTSSYYSSQESETDYINVTMQTGYNSVPLHIHSPLNALDFPIISCVVSGNQDVENAGRTINVLAGHNVKVGMCLRIPVSNEQTFVSAAPKDGYSIIMSKVTAVTATTISLARGVTNGKYAYLRTPYLITGTVVSGSTTITMDTTNVKMNDSISGVGIAANTYIVQVLTSTTAELSIAATANDTGTKTINSRGSVTTLLIQGQVLNGGYTKAEYENQITNVNYTNYWQPEIKFGAFVRVFRSLADTDTFVKLIDLEVPHNFPYGSATYVPCYDLFLESQPVSGLSRIGIESLDQGSDLPRACKYLSTWQNQIVQGGRTVDPSLAEDQYPYSLYSEPLNDWAYVDNSYNGFKYTEAHLCDNQSFYWNDSLTPEGFPQSGLFESFVQSPYSEKLKGFGVSKDALFVFKDMSTTVVTGTLSTQDLVLELLEDNIGCVNHRTIQNVKGMLVWLDSREGFYSCVAGRLPVNIGYYISDEFKVNPDGLNIKNSFAQVYDTESIYLCVVDTKIFVYDFESLPNSPMRNAWYMWQPFTAKTMLSLSDGTFLLSDGDKTWKFKRTGTKYDYCNHTSAIDFNYISAWQSYSTPVIDKHFLECWINSIQGDFSLTVSQYGNFLDTSLGDYVISFPAESDKKTVKEQMKLTYPKLSSSSIGFANNAVNAYVRVQGWELHLRDDFDKDEPRR